MSPIPTSAMECLTAMPCLQEVETSTIGVWSQRFLSSRHLSIINNKNKIRKPIYENLPGLCQLSKKKTLKFQSPAARILALNKKT